MGKVLLLTGQPRKTQPQQGSSSWKALKSWLAKLNNRSEQGWGYIFYIGLQPGIPALGKPSEGQKPWIFLVIWLSGTGFLTVLGAQPYTSPLLCHVLSSISLFELGQCSLKLYQSKQVLSISLISWMPERSSWCYHRVFCTLVHCVDYACFSSAYCCCSSQL